MAKTASTITVRKLDEGVKRQLRLRAAANARSMEDEVRSILRQSLAGEGRGDSAPIEQPAAPSAPVGASVRARTGIDGATVLLIVGGGIAAYKSLDLIRRLRERGAGVRAVMTSAAQEFVTPLSVGALAGGRVFTDLFDQDDEFDVGHIRLAREADIVIVAPATADLMARMASGRADDLASAVLLAARAPILLAPAMNPAMWSHPATRRNAATLVADGIGFVGPNAGEMAEAGEAGIGRMAEPMEILAAAEAILSPENRLLAGRHVVVTSGPTQEPIDPVRYLANRSSGRQGHAIAAAAARAGARVTLVSGPVAIPDPPSVTIVRVETARQMLDAVVAALPADVAVMAAAVADWRVAAESVSKIKKGQAAPAALPLAENPDILATVAAHPTLRPKLVVGFAAETDDLLANAAAKLKKKGADWIVANDVSPEKGVMGGDRNTVHILSAPEGKPMVEDWPELSKDEVAKRLVARIAGALRG
jgi:phosphopantothenoylcysteine decarboxylase/phosphopantothenate--cysteine ligase